LEVGAFDPMYYFFMHWYFIIIIIFLHALGRLTCSVIDALPSFPRASTISSSSRFVVEGVFRKSGAVHSFKMVDPVLFVFGSHVLHSRDLQFFSYNFASYFVWSFVSFNPLNAELNPICYLLALLGAHHFLLVSRIRVKSLILRLLMSYIYIYIYIWH